MVTFHEPSQLLAVGGMDGLISVFDLKQGTRIHLLDMRARDTSRDPHSHHPTCDALTSQLLSDDEQGPTPGVSAMSFNAQGRVMAVYSYQDNQVYFWQMYSALSFFGFSLRPQLVRSCAVPRVPFLWSDIRINWVSQKEGSIIRGKAAFDFSM